MLVSLSLCGSHTYPFIHHYKYWSLHKSALVSYLKWEGCIVLGHIARGVLILWCIKHGAFLHAGHYSLLVQPTSSIPAVAWQSLPTAWPVKVNGGMWRMYNVQKLLNYPELRGAAHFMFLEFHITTYNMKNGYAGMAVVVWLPRGQYADTYYVVHM